MTPRTWALKAVDKIMERLDCSCKTCAGPGYAKLLEAEHARAVRIVKREIARLAQLIRQDQQHKHTDAESIHTYAYSTLEDILAALTKGRTT